MRASPRRRLARALTLSVLVGALSACGERAAKEGEPPRAGAIGNAQAAQSASEGTGATSATTKPVCPATGAWQLCNVIERLERAGLAPREQPGRVQEPPLSSPGVAILLGKSELRVFLYADKSARERDQVKLDKKTYISASEPVSMQAEPTLVVSENLLAILRSRSDHQRERVSDALTAGPPQRPGPKS